MTPSMREIEQRVGPLRDYLLTRINATGSVADVAAELHIAPQTLYTWLKRLGINLSGKHITRPLHTALEQQHGKPIRQVVVDALNEHGGITPATAKALGVSKGTLSVWVREFGISKKWY